MILWLILRFRDEIYNFKTKIIQKVYKKKFKQMFTQSFKNICNKAVKRQQKF